MIRRLFSGWFQLPTVSPLEGFLSRLLFACILIYTLRLGVQFTTEPHPVGLLKILHGIDDHRTWLTWLSDPGTYSVFRWIFVGLSVLYVSGYALPVVLPAMAVMHILPFTLFNSQGYTYHGAQMVSLVLIIQALTVLYYTFFEKFSFSLPVAKLRSWLLVQSMVIVTGAYFVSVIAKMDNSGGMWLWNSNNIALDMVKTQRQSYNNKLEEKYAGTPPEAKWMLDNPWTARAVFSSGVILETICIIGIGHRTLAFLIGISLIAMHRSIDRLMGGVAFPYNEFMDFTFLMGAPFLAGWCIERIPRKASQIGLVAGLIIGVPLSFFAQPERHQTLRPFAIYPLEIINSLGFWASQEWGKFFELMNPVFLVCCGCAVIGAGIGWFMSKGQEQGERSMS